MRKLFSIYAFALLVGCGDNQAPEQTDAPPTPDAPPPFAEAPHGTPAHLINLGGTVLAAPVVQPIFFMGDDAMQAQVEDFLTQLSTSTYWTATTTEYGVGSLSIKPTVVTTATPPTTDADLQTWLATQFDGTHAGWPATPDANTIYSVFLPAGVVLHTDFGDSCQDFGAYHDEASGTHSESIVYALMPRCGSGGNMAGSTAEVVDALTTSTSHELIEAATNPRVETAPAFGDSDIDNYVMSFTPGAEAGDYCEYLPSAEQRLVGTYAVQRTWSNAASFAGTDPCVPAIAGNPYLGAAAMLTDATSLDGFSGPVTTKGVEVALHATKTVDVALFSDVPTDDFTVKAVDLAAAFDGSAAELSFTWDKTTGKNGDILHLTITRNVSGQLPGSEFLIETKNANKTVGMWWGFAAN